MSEKVKISVCMPIYNNAQVIRPAVDSIIAQKGAKFELIFVDNASTDGTTAILEEYCKKCKFARLVKKKKTTTVRENFNDCIREAKGEYVAIFHGDDIYKDTIVAKEAQFLDTHPQIAAVFTESKIINDELKVFGKGGPLEPGKKEIFGLKEILRSLVINSHNPLTCPTFMGRKSNLPPPPWFLDSQSYANDVGFFLRILEKHPIGIIREPLHLYRRSLQHGALTAVTTLQQQNPIYQILDGHIQKHKEWFSPDELKLYSLLKRSNLWLAAISADAAGNSQVAKEIWEKSFSYSSLASSVKYRQMWAKSAAALAFDISQKAGLSRQWAQIVQKRRLSQAK
ncbi:hypothetical protein COU37_05640 [Candidatus Micrarchaeota archaeon CG10_big_fil_rev_8_21_14_0_10_45_29]|nr:MAG: hypothetical protein COU37_05640 [Candidatus Micrarchaeota archaeon CG10_big_fil_rev_8_21_14_0_10_45_29]